MYIVFQSVDIVAMMVGDEVATTSSEKKSSKRKKLTNLQRVLIALTKEKVKRTLMASAPSAKVSEIIVAKEKTSKKQEDRVKNKMEILVSCDSTNVDLDTSLVKRIKLSESIVEVKSIEVANNPAPVPSSISVAKRTSNSVAKGKSAENSQSMKVNIDYKRPQAADKVVDPMHDENEYDDTCSVLSGILEEDICYTCGKSTINSEEWGSVVLCDGCNGEYHLQCAGLESIPESNFICYKCSKEMSHFKEMDFSVSDFFPVRIFFDYSLIFSWQS